MEAILYLVSHCCLLRVRSEALPIVLGDTSMLGRPLAGLPALLIVGESEVVLRLARRKNRTEETVITRECVCARSRSMCCVHVLGELTKSIPTGSQLFAGYTGSQALAALRSRLRKIGVADADAYRLHDFRRGHAQDLATRGRSLSTILKAGDWRSSAFTAYLDTADIEVLFFVAF